MRAIIYDIEILRAIQSKNETRIEGIEYCEGWRDHVNMGISVIGALDYQDQRPRVFLQDNFDTFKKLVSDGCLMVGFNSIAFDNKTIEAVLGIHIPDDQSYDILRELWKAAGLGPDYVHGTHGGYGLDAVCEKNFGMRKSGNGAYAPVLWQRGQRGEVIDYCMNDIAMTVRLFTHIAMGRPVISPKDGAELRLPIPDLTVPLYK